MNETTQIIYNIIVAHPGILKQIQDFWNVPVRDAEGFESMPDRACRIEDIKDMFYIRAANIDFKNSFMSDVFDALTDDINWAELEILLYEGASDED